MPYRAGRASTAARRPPPWVFTGGAFLAATAGYINVCVLAFFHVPVSHMTGAVSRVSLDLQEQDVTDLRLTLLILASFLIGAAISGIIIGGIKLVPGRRYGVAMALEGVVLAGATVMLMRGMSGGVALAALACGIQNAMASSYYGLIIRTTHVTGIVTDIGVMIGHWLRHRRVRGWKLMLLSSIFFGFLLGGLAGAAAVNRFGAAALGAASVACLLAGGSYYVWRHGQRGSRAPAHVATGAFSTAASQTRKRRSEGG